MGKLTLDQSAFKALSSETRLEILKRLDGRQKTLSDLSKEMDLTKATLHEHLNKLTEAELVSRREREGHKLVYYKLSWKGASLLHPEKTYIGVMLSSAAASIIVGMVALVRYLTFKRPEAVETFNITKGPTEEAIDPDLLLIIAVVLISIFAILLAASIVLHRKGRVRY
jgi:DNA-binding transcriptional ArsR family regulator